MMSFLKKKMVRELSALTGKKIETCDPLSGGKNSRVFKCVCEDKTHLIAKYYHYNTNDKRNRLDVEFRAFSFLCEKGVKVVPDALFRSDSLGVGVYGFVPGVQAINTDITPNDIEQIIHFIRELKDLSTHPEARYLPQASDACYCTRTIIEQVESRLERLIDVTSADDSIPVKLLKSYLQNRFIPAFRYFQEQSIHQATTDFFNRDIPISKRTLSPSDFGFHNAIRDEKGSLTFIDFEYFGWDDPAKLISDFLLHPAMTLSTSIKQLVVEGIIGVFSEDDALEERLNTVFPIIGLKWCMILLNEFINDQMERRQFSGDTGNNRNKVLEKQLKKADIMLNVIMEIKDGNGV